MIIHIEGSHIPSTPPLPEYIKADIYLPLVMVNEHPESHQAIVNIVQSFIEAVGIPTIQCWTHTGKKLGWLLSDHGQVFTPAEVPHTLVPLPCAGSSHYQFFGRPYSSISPSPHSSSSSDDSSNLDDPVSSHTQPVTAARSERFGSEEPMSPTILSLLDALERIETLRTNLTAADLREQSFIMHVHALSDRLKEKDGEIATLHAQLAENNLSSNSTVSSVSSITTSELQTPRCDYSFKNGPGNNNFALKFALVDPVLSPKPAPSPVQPFSPPSASQQGSNKSSTFLPKFPTLSMPSSSHAIQNQKD
jgi:hypothetical protein